MASNREKEVMKKIRFAEEQMVTILQVGKAPAGDGWLGVPGRMTSYSTPVQRPATESPDGGPRGRK